MSGITGVTGVHTGGLGEIAEPKPVEPDGAAAPPAAPERGDAGGGTRSDVLSRLGAPGPVDTRDRVDLSDPQLGKAYERILANIGGPRSRFGGVDDGEGLLAFAVDEQTLSRVIDPAMQAKLDEIGGDPSAIGVLTTGEAPVLTLAAASGDKVHILATIPLMDDEAAARLPGDGDPLQRTAALFGQAPVFELGGTKPPFYPAASDWTTGEGFASRVTIRDERNAAREAARAERAAAREEALAGPTTPEAFAAAGVRGHKHTADEKARLFDLVKRNAGEDQTFPDPNESYYGLHTFLLEGPEAAHALAFAQANGAGRAGFDPEKHSLVVTIKSFDEAQVGTYVIDRETEEVLFADESSATDVYEDAAAAFFPGATPDEGLDAWVIGTLALHGELLGVIPGDDPPDDMDFADWLPERG